MGVLEGAATAEEEPEKDEEEDKVDDAAAVITPAGACVKATAANQEDQDDEEDDHGAECSTFGDGGGSEEVDVGAVPGGRGGVEGARRLPGRRARGGWRASSGDYALGFGVCGGETKAVRSFRFASLQPSAERSPLMPTSSS